MVLYIRGIGAAGTSVTMDWLSLRSQAKFTHMRTHTHVIPLIVSYFSVSSPQVFVNVSSSVGRRYIEEAPWAALMQRCD